jgi:hypothetical protein
VINRLSFLCLCGPLLFSRKLVLVVAETGGGLTATTPMKAVGVRYEAQWN